MALPYMRRLPWSRAARGDAGSCGCRQSALGAEGIAGGHKLWFGAVFWEGSAGGKEVLDGSEDRAAIFGLEYLLAQGGAAGDAVGKPAGELLHLADGLAKG